MSDLFDFYPYAERFGVNRELPDGGRSREEILAELREMATEEDAVWEDGKCSGTMYCGDHDHYDFLNEAFGLFAHVRTPCSATCARARPGSRARSSRWRSRPDARRRGRRTATRPGWSPRAAAAASCTPLLAYREQGREARGDRPAQLRQARDRPPAFDKACHLFGIELRRVAGRPETTLVGRTTSRRLIDDDTVAIVGSACNYGYGTIDPIAELGRACRSIAGVGLHVDGCLGGFILPFGEELGYPTSRRSTSGSPASPRSRPTPTSTATGSRAPRRCSSATRRCATRSTSSCPTGAAASTSRPAWRARARAGCSPRTWASMVSLGREGYRELREARSSRPSPRCRTRSAPTASCGCMGEPTFCFSFTSDEFDIYHVNDFMSGGAGASTASSTRTRSTWPSPARRPSPASSRRSRTTSPPPSRTRCEHATSPPSRAPSTAASRAASTPTPKRWSEA